jgi:tetratricopeptide (TPR) repeat protein
MPPRTVTVIAATIAGAAAFAGGLAIDRSDDTATRPADAQASARTAGTPGLISRYSAAVRANPQNPDGYALLSAAYQQSSRESTESGLFERAEENVRRGLRIAPGDPGLLTQRASLLLARHQFRDALRDADRAHRTDPTLRRTYGALTDSLIELGRYERAGRILQEGIDRGPTLGLYARAAYFQELHGDIAGAARALRLAASAGGESAENVAYVQTLLGNLELASGRRAAALRAYRTAAARLPGYQSAQLGLGRLDAQRGRLAAAERRIGAVARANPNPESLTALLEVRVAAGHPQATRTRDELREVFRELAAGGENTGVERGLFEAQYGSRELALRYARAGLRDSPSVRAHDALALALVRNERPREALRHARLALRLGTRDGSTLYRAALTAQAAGRTDLARIWVRRALERNPRFSPVDGPAAQQLARDL